MTDVAVPRRAANASALRDSPTARLAVHIDAGTSGVVDISNLCPDGATLGPMPALHSRDATPAAATDASAPTDRTMLWALTGTAAAAVVALCAVVVSTSPQPRIVVQERPTTHAALSEMGLDADTPPAVSETETIDLTRTDRSEDEPVIFDEEPALQAEPDPPESSANKTSANKTSANKTSARKTRADKTRADETRADKTTPTRPAVATPTTNDTLPSVDCILDPSKCTTSKPSAPKANPGTSPTQDLPDKLTSSVLRTHLAGAKSKAKQCGPRHGAPDGVRVQVKLSIAGATGLVTSASVQGDDHGSALGTCVADALSSASFPRFSAPSQGVVYTVTL